MAKTSPKCSFSIILRDGAIFFYRNFFAEMYVMLYHHRLFCMWICMSGHRSIGYLRYTRRLVGWAFEEPWLTCPHVFSLTTGVYQVSDCLCCYHNDHCPSYFQFSYDSVVCWVFDGPCRHIITIIIIAEYYLVLISLWS